MITTKLNDDRTVLTIMRTVPGGVLTTTLYRDRNMPFTDEEVDRAVALSLDKGGTMMTGQRNKTRRTVTRFGTIWTHVMTGPPTWRKPRFRHEKDGTLMAGWLRLAVAVKFERKKA